MYGMGMAAMGYGAMGAMPYAPQPQQPQQAYGRCLAIALAHDPCS